jgi:hypothetical protein
MERLVKRVHIEIIAFILEKLEEYLRNKFHRMLYQAAEAESLYFLQSKFDDESSGIIEEMLSNKKEFRKVLKSRSHLSASGKDWLPYSLIKIGGEHAADALSRISAQMWRCRKCPSIWKNAR